MFYKHVGSATEMDTGFWGGGRGQVPSAKASVEPRWPLAGRGVAGPQLGWTPAGQLCGTAAIVEQNSFLITHLASQFNRKYSSCIFFSLSLNLKEIRKEKLIFSLNN